MCDPEHLPRTRRGRTLWVVGFLLLAVLSLVAGLLVRAFDSDDARPPAPTEGPIVTRALPTPAADRGPGLEVTLRSFSSPQARVSTASIDQAIRVIERRARRFGISGAEVAPEGEDRIVVFLPGTQDPARFLEELIRPARLGMYDYEASRVAGGTTATPRALALQASRTPDEGLGAPRLYLFDRTPEHRLLAGPGTSREALLASGPGLAARCADESACELIRTPASLALMRRPADEDGGWDLLREPAAVLGRDVAGASSSPGSGSGEDAQVDIEFTEGGASRFHDLTRGVAVRGARLAMRQRIVIALDSRIVTIAALDPDRYPDGIDGRSGASISGDLTAEEAETLSGQLASGAVPLALEVVSRRRV